MRVEDQRTVNLMPFAPADPRDRERDVCLAVGKQFAT